MLREVDAQLARDNLQSKVPRLPAASAYKTSLSPKLNRVPRREARLVDATSVRDAHSTHRYLADLRVLSHEPLRSDSTGWAVDQVGVQPHSNRAPSSAASTTQDECLPASLSGTKRKPDMLVGPIPPILKQVRMTTSQEIEQSASSTSGERSAVVSAIRESTKDKTVRSIRSHIFHPP